mmetsp:Transcript_4948/g.13830  ORF Transcript_4948/g.13830 Transcript_4948/m.13830 type:complete len:322 (+) Transcript_4948:127-1092(+)
MPQITALHIYPVKSCNGISLQSAVVAKTGLAYDRYWVVIDADSGRFLSQRVNQKLTLIDVSLPPEALLPEWGALPPDAALCLSAPGMAPLQVPLNPTSSSLARAQLKNVSVWDWRGKGRDEGEFAAEWLSEVLGQPCRLLRYVGSDAASLDDPTRRQLDPNWVDPSKGLETAFSDGFPFLLTSTESLADLNQQMDKAVPMNRFRPNIVVSGLEGPWVEDTWAELEVGGGGSNPPTRFQSPKPCARCKITTVNQTTGEVGKEPLRTLVAVRGLNLGWRKVSAELVGAFFGWNLTTSSVGTVLAVGDSVLATQLRDRTTLQPI